MEMEMYTETMDTQIMEMDAAVETTSTSDNFNKTFAALLNNPTNESHCCAEFFELCVFYKKLNDNNIKNLNLFRALYFLFENNGMINHRDSERPITVDLIQNVMCDCVKWDESDVDLNSFMTSFANF